MTATHVSPLTWRALVVLPLLALGCRGTEDRSTWSEQRTFLPGAEQSLARYLTAQEFDAFDAAVTDEVSVAECDPVGVVEPTYWLATSRVLSSATERDTAFVTAEVQSVAIEEGEPDSIGRRVRVRLTTDTATWRVVQQGPSTAWRVCGISIEGIDFSPIGDSTHIRLQGSDVSLSSIRALADSARRVTR